jgi:hypothetical protein
MCGVTKSTPPNRRTRLFARDVERSPRIIVQFQFRLVTFVYATRIAATVPVNYFGNTAIVDLHCVKITDIDNTSNANYAKSRVGQAKVRMLETFEVPNTPSEFANNTVRKLFFYDVVGDIITGNIVAATVNNVTAITLTMAIATGIPHVNNAIEGATIVLGGASSPVSGTFTVNNYVYANATHAFATLKEFLPTLPNANTTYKLIFQMKDVDSASRSSMVLSPRSTRRSLRTSRSKPTCTRTASSTASERLHGCRRHERRRVALPDSGKVRQGEHHLVGHAVWKSWMKTTANAQTFAAQANLAFTLTLSGNNFSVPTGNLTATTASQYFIVFDQTNDANGHGRIINFFDTPGATDKCISNVVVTRSVRLQHYVHVLLRRGHLDDPLARRDGEEHRHRFGSSPEDAHRRQHDRVVSKHNQALSQGQIEFYS